MDVDAILQLSQARRICQQLESYATWRDRFDQATAMDCMGLTQNEADLFEQTLGVVLGTQTAAPAPPGTAATNALETEGTTSREA